MGDETVNLLIDDDVDDDVSGVTQIENRNGHQYTDHIEVDIESPGYPGASVNINTDEGDVELIDTGLCVSQGSVAPTLPTGKQAHIFISYSSEDRDTVLPLVTRIEDECGFKCIFDERDFQPGMQIHDNIKRAMDISMKVLLFLSENFTRSGYCNYEKDLAFIISLENGGNNVIPVKLEDCHIPSTLKTLTYVDATKEDTDLPQKIAEAFNKTDACEMLPFWTGSPNAILENGFFLDIPCDVERNCPWYPKVDKTTLTDATRLMIHNAKFKVPIEAFEKALGIVNKFRMRGRWPRYDCRVQICLSCCGVLFIPVLIFFVYGLCGVLVVQNTDICSNFVIFTITAAFSLPVLIPLTIYIYYKCRQQTDINRLKEEIFEEVTLDTYKDGALFEISLRKTKCNTYIGLRAIRYDIHPCCKFLARHIKTRVETKLGKDVDRSEVFDDLADGKIKMHISRLMNAEADIPYASVTRHPVKGGKSCICQMLEPQISDEYVGLVCDTCFRMEYRDTI